MNVGKTTKHQALTTMVLMFKECGEQERQTIVQRKEYKSADREVNAEAGCWKSEEAKVESNSEIQEGDRCSLDVSS